MTQFLKKCFLFVVVVIGALHSIFAVAADDTPEALQSEYLFDLVLDTTAPQMMGQRMVVPVTGGHFTGSTLKGTVVDVGADWIRNRPDGVSELDVRITLKTDDDALIYMSYQGIMNRAENYWRVVPKFETGAEKYAYLTKLVAVCIGKRVDGKVAYSFYKIL